MGKPRVQWACQGWTLGGRDGQGWTPGCRLTTRARKLKVVAAAQQSYPRRLWQSGAPATGMCASLSTLCTKRSRVTFRARRISSSGQLHASRAYSCCSGLVGVGMGKGWAPWLMTGPKVSALLKSKWNADQGEGAWRLDLDHVPRGPPRGRADSESDEEEDE